MNSQKKKNTIGILIILAFLSILVTRDAVWLKATWDEHIRPKHKKSLDKWNKDTGGGDGTATSFVDFCAGDWWLVWLFCLDMDVNFLLANSAGGRMPVHLQFKASFEEEDVSSCGASSSSKTGQLERELASAKNQRQQLNNTLDKIDSFLDGSNKDSDFADHCIDKVAKHSGMLQDTAVLATMSPDSKEQHMNAIKKKRKSVLNNIHDTKRNEDKQLAEEEDWESIAMFNCNQLIC